MNSPKMICSRISNLVFLLLLLLLRSSSYIIFGLLVLLQKGLRMLETCVAAPRHACEHALPLRRRGQGLRFGGAHAGPATSADGAELPQGNSVWVSDGSENTRK